MSAMKKDYSHLDSPLCGGDSSTVSNCVRGLSPYALPKTGKGGRERFRARGIAVVSVVFLALCFAWGARGEAVQVGDFWFELRSADGSASLTAPASGAYDLEEAAVPGSVVAGDAAYRVTAIGRDAFKGSSVRRVSVPASVTLIDGGAFFDCAMLESFRFERADEALKVADMIFNGGTSVSPVEMSLYCGRPLEIDVPNSSTKRMLNGINVARFELEGVESLSERYMASCGSLREVTLHEGLRALETGAFKMCSSLRGLVVPEGVESIGQYAFDGCKMLEAITLPSSLVLVDQFFECSGLKDMYVYAQEPPALIGGAKSPYPDSASAKGTVHVLNDAEVVARYEDSVWGSLPARYVIAGDLEAGQPVRGHELRLTAVGEGSLSVLVDGVGAAGTSSEDGELTVVVPDDASSVVVVASPGVGMDVASVAALDKEGHRLATGNGVRGRSLLCGIGVETTRVEARFSPENARTLHVLMPGGEGSRMTLDLPEGLPYRFGYTSGEGFRLRGALLDDEELPVSEPEDGVASVEIPHYEGARTLRLVEEEDGAVTAVGSTGEGMERGRVRLAMADGVAELRGLEDGEAVTVCSTDGVLLYRGRAAMGSLRLPSHLRGICLIRTAGVTLKTNL